MLPEPITVKTVASGNYTRGTHMLILPTFLLIAALVFFAVSTAGVPSPPRFQWLGAGLFCVTLAYLLGQYGGHLL